MGLEIKTKPIGVKNTVICYLRLGAQKILAKGEVDWGKLFNGKRRRSWSILANSGTSLQTAPPEEKIISYEPNACSRCRACSGMTTKEFSRLIGILLEQGHARRALLQ